MPQYPSGNSLAGGSVEVTDGSTGIVNPATKIVFSGATVTKVGSNTANVGITGMGGISGMTAGQVPIAATAGTITSSLPLSGTTGATEVASATSAAKTSGHLATWNANGNLIDGGAVPTNAVTSVAAQTGAVIFGEAVVVGATTGAITVTGLPSTSTLLAVLGFVGAGTAVTDVVDQTANFSVTGTNTITGTGNTTGSKLFVLWAS